MRYTGQLRRTIPDIDRALGPTLRRLIDNAPVWPDEQIPPKRHRCDTYSKAGLTKKPAKVFEDSPYSMEVCPCGGYRNLLNGRPNTPWVDKNMARRDPNWWTRRDRPGPVTADG